MHELSLIHQVIKTIDEVKEEQELTEVESITLQIGEMSDVVPAFITQAWDNAKVLSAYADTKLFVETVKARAQCNDCGEINDARNIDFRCPNCGSLSLSIISGREFLIKEIVAK